MQERVEVALKVEHVDRAIFSQISARAQECLTQLFAQNNIAELVTRRQADLSIATQRNREDRKRIGGEWESDLAYHTGEPKSEIAMYVEDLKRLQEAAESGNKRKVLYHLGRVANHESYFDSPPSLNFKWDYRLLAGLQKIATDASGLYQASALMRSPSMLSDRDVAHFEYLPEVLGKPFNANHPSSQDVDYNTDPREAAQDIF